MIPNILGIDLGTSGIKLIYSTKSGSLKVREEYEECTPNGWWKALCKATMQLDLSEVKSIGLSSQVGTYIVNGEESIGWSEPVGQAELEEIIGLETQDIFLQEISMPHPRILSYPLPRLRYIQNHYGMPKSVCMPKDYLIEKLTGRCVSDPFSWRGLANLKTFEYSTYLLEKLGIDENILPPLEKPEALVGGVTAEASVLTGIPQGTPVYVGCNDFFAGLLGMGMIHSGSMFDITGTSEHLGLITEQEPNLETSLVHGPYFQYHAQYGVTASSGASLDFGRSLYDLNDETLFSCIENNPPIFLPYLNGERAPIWDAKASGVFFGITQETTTKELAYAVMEGVAFSLYHIYANMGYPEVEYITVAGGAAKNNVLCEIKATLFDLPVVTLCENDTSALGAQMLAAIGSGAYADLEEAIKDNCIVKQRSLPNKTKKGKLRERFEIYKGLYPALKEPFHIFHESMR